jgi:hypothetical protein
LKNDTPKSSIHNEKYFTIVATSNVTVFKKMVMEFLLLVDLEDMFKILGALHL